MLLIACLTSCAIADEIPMTPAENLEFFSVFVIGKLDTIEKIDPLPKPFTSTEVTGNFLISKILKNQTGTNIVAGRCIGVKIHLENVDWEHVRQDKTSDLHLWCFKRSDDGRFWGGYFYDNWVVDYKVQAGDTLWSLAVKYYGDGNQWRTIQAYNSKTLCNPSALRAGTILYLLKNPLGTNGVQQGSVKISNKSR